MHRHTRTTALVLLLLLGSALASQALRTDLPQEEVGLLTATHYGAGACDATTLNAAISAIGSTVATLILPPYARNSNTPCTWVLAAGVTFPTTLTPLIPSGTLLQPAAGITLTLGTCPLASLRRIFDADETTTGSVRYGAQCAEAFPGHWGTGPTTVELASRALMTHGGQVTLPLGTLTQAAITAYSGVSLRGHGIGRTTLQLANNEQGTLWGNHVALASLVEDSITDCGLHDMTLDGNQANQDQTSVNVQGQVGLGVIRPGGMSRCRFANLRVINAAKDCLNFAKAKDNVVENVECDTPHRSGIAITGTSLRSQYRNIRVLTPYQTCFDIEPSASQATDLHITGNLLDGLYCDRPGEYPGGGSASGGHGVTSTFGIVGATFTGTRERNVLTNITVVMGTNSSECAILADLNDTMLSNIVCIGAQTGNGSGIWLGAFTEYLSVANLTLSGCMVRNSPRHGVYVSDGADPEVGSPPTVTGVAISGCVLRDNGRRFIGTHNGAANSPTLIDTTVDFTTLLSDFTALEERLVHNATDGSHGRIVAVAATVLTLDPTLTGGTDNDWDPGDTYYLVFSSDLRIDSNVSQVTVGGTTAETTSFAGPLLAANIQGIGQSPVPTKPSVAGRLYAEGLFDTYVILGTGAITNIKRSDNWLGRVLTLVFTAGDTQVASNGIQEDGTGDLFLLHNDATSWFCAGDTLTVQYRHNTVTDQKHWVELGRNKVAGEVLVTSTTETPSVACATSIRFLQASATNVLNLTHAEDNQVYTLYFDNDNTTLREVDGDGGSFHLHNNISVNPTSNDVLQVWRRRGGTFFRQIAPRMDAVP